MNTGKLSFLGDVVLDRPYKVDIALDHFIFNLEHPLSCEGTPVRNKVNFCADRSYIRETFGKFPLAVNLANNHIADFGEKAFVKTVDFLTEKNVAFFGAGKEEENFNNPAIVEFEGKRIALFGYSCPSTSPVFGNKEQYGSAPLIIERVCQDLIKTRKNADLLIVNLHWGLENFRYPRPEDVEIARKIIDYGADIIIGHHAHVIQSYEKYKGKHIFYGLGHFIFPYKERPSYFDGNRFQKVHNPIPRRSNREGLVINMDSMENISLEAIYFDGQGVSKIDPRIPRWVPESKLVFSAYKKLLLRYRLILHFIRNPKVPSLSQLKHFLGV